LTPAAVAVHVDAAAGPDFPRLSPLSSESGP